MQVEGLLHVYFDEIDDAPQLLSGKSTGRGACRLCPVADFPKLPGLICCNARGRDVGESGGACIAPETLNTGRTTPWVRGELSK
jgi:hypothetical protein